MKTAEKRLSRALKDFKKKYPSVTSVDLQTFLLGWLAAEEEYSNQTKEPQDEEDEFGLVDFTNVMPDEIIINRANFGTDQDEVGDEFKLGFVNSIEGFRIDFFPTPTSQKGVGTLLVHPNDYESIKATMESKPN